MKRALFGVKSMKDVMENNGDKHRHLMKSLRHSIDKKKVGTSVCGISHKLHLTHSLMKLCVPIGSSMVMLFPSQNYITSCR